MERKKNKIFLSKENEGREESRKADVIYCPEEARQQLPNALVKPMLLDL